MASTVTYIPQCHCVCCLNATSELVAATTTVGRYQACDSHAPLLKRSASLGEALRAIKPQQGEGNPT